MHCWLKLRLQQCVNFSPGAARECKCWERGNWVYKHGHVAQKIVTSHADGLMPTVVWYTKNACENVFQCRNTNTVKRLCCNRKLQIQIVFQKYYCDTLAQLCVKWAE